MRIVSSLRHFLPRRFVSLTLSGIPVASYRDCVTLSERRMRLLSRLHHASFGFSRFIAKGATWRSIDGCGAGN